MLGPEYLRRAIRELVVELEYDLSDERRRPLHLDASTRDYAVRLFQLLALYPDCLPEPLVRAIVEYVGLPGLSPPGGNPESKGV